MNIHLDCNDFKFFFCVVRFRLLKHKIIIMRKIILNKINKVTSLLLNICLVFSSVDFGGVELSLVIFETSQVLCFPERNKYNKNSDK